MQFLFSCNVEDLLFTAGPFLRIPSGKQLFAGKILQMLSRSKKRMLHSGKSCNEFFTGRVQRLLWIPVQCGSDADCGEQHVAQLLVDIRAVTDGLAQLIGLFC